MTCRQATCSTDCLTPSEPLRSRLGRLAVTTRAAATVGWALIVVRLATVGGGYSAVRRGSWALHRVCGPMVGALGVRTEVTGSPRSGAALVVGNHLSWLDILVLSASTPMRQVAKSEIGDWPLIAGAARRTGSIFLDRSRWRLLPAVVDQATTALRQGHKVQAFPEATTRCGGAIGEFHRCLFQAAIDAAVVVAPVTIRYLDRAGNPTVTPTFLGDEDLMTSLRRLLSMRGVWVQVHWLPVVPAIARTSRPAADRARLAGLVQRAVATDLRVMVAPRPGRVHCSPCAAGSLSPAAQPVGRGSARRRLPWRRCPTSIMPPPPRSYRRWPLLLPRR